MAVFVYPVKEFQREMQSMIRHFDRDFPDDVARLEWIWVYL